ncbi:hypothetical protein CYMTET_38958 [Cymbomonas tetramitiformis]|uniref:Uncharacterized protein n=1 Tax=Cymbomonas tetramitiformis TaxID=36881 RepID=A0AAE0CD67_9CHLO|nr:hypothetical protein CYMTET_38958 [Cymbomonas tetramitiformis]
MSKHVSNATEHNRLNGGVLVIGDNSFELPFIKRTRKQISQHHKLDFSRAVYAMNDEGLKEVVHLNPHITHLDLGRCDKITDVGTVCLHGLKNLKYLNLYGCYELTDISHIMRLTFLTRLNLSGMNDVSSSALRELSKLTRLQQLHLSDNDKVDDEVIKSISQLQRLTHLNLSLLFGRISNDGLYCVAAMPVLTHLNLYCCTNITADIFSRFGQGLQVLILQNERKLMKDLYCHIHNIGTLQVVGGIRPIEFDDGSGDDSDDESVPIFSREEWHDLKDRGVKIDNDYINFPMTM